MNKIFKRILMAFYAAILLVLTVQCGQLREAKETSAQNLKASRDSISYFKLKDGSYAAEKRSYEVTLKEYKTAVLRSRDSIRQMRERIGNLNNLVNDLNLQLSIQDFVSAPIEDTAIIHNEDTVRLHRIGYRDKWLSLHGLLYPDTLKLNYEVRAGLGIAHHWKKEGLFKPRYLNVNAHSDNPHLRVTGLENFQIRDKKPFYKTRGFAFAAGALSAISVPHLLNTLR